MIDDPGGMFVFVTQRVAHMSDLCVDELDLLVNEIRRENLRADIEQRANGRACPQICRRFRELVVRFLERLLFCLYEFRCRARRRRCGRLALRAFELALGLLHIPRCLLVDLTMCVELFKHADLAGPGFRGATAPVARGLRCRPGSRLVGGIASHQLAYRLGLHGVTEAWNRSQRTHPERALWSLVDFRQYRQRCIECRFDSIGDLICLSQ
ncbi:hypothetical protein [Paraburkholderia megapolitana]|uniref:hypothetical protein n=1 Tax=Paraburkholderia megapolitana TaxID=420953 RepID=UPI0038BB7622